MRDRLTVIVVRRQLSRPVIVSMFWTAVIVTDDLSILVVWYTTGVRITRSARRHGVSDEAIRHAVTNAIRLVDTDDGVFVIGADTSGQMLELVARRLTTVT